MIRRKLIGLSALATMTALAAALPMLAQAQSDYPNKPVKIIVPFPPGGTSDVMGRMLADELTKILKQPFVVENIGGAGGVIGTDRAVKLPADGYTLIQTGVGQNAVAHGLEPGIKYNSLTDFVHISQVHSGPNVLVVHPSTPYKSVKDVVAYAKANPGKLDYGYTHAASGHMAMELFKQTTGIFMTGIPYRGGGPMMTDVLGGTIPMMFINQDVALPHVKAGKLRALAVTSTQRNPLYPDVPTIAESGYKGFEALSWSGMSVAKGTPQPIVDKLEAAISQAMQSDAIKQRMGSTGFVIPQQGVKPYTAFVKSELDTWTRVIKTAGIKPQ
ncbi:MAG TPA: tripartite tricarboxylate transporter substrate binding protein [Polaromonas sp.]|uniref:Bug family tripartite tricarboxylate transporter substrate binding protein n=1 Tax=Polaromonas sp. TaxID=1869339 RepID=UPI002D57C6B5|nr:tripartite tricarboxylate transporter substrate binding protein [Polaromonas sp.]HYW57803.1 tripartite tricarboxylate transporter substrate binding protein [Polaromonas sp.]